MKKTFQHLTRKMSFCFLALILAATAWAQQRNAEALNENGKTNEALTYLNQVRSRAGLAGYSGLTQSDAREKIYLERRFELYLVPLRKPSIF